jgi:rare lipoprotein A
MHQMTAAHRTLEFGTVVRVTRRDTGRQVEVRINDRGPFIEGRIIDLSYAAARKIGLDVDGIAPVVVEVLDRRAAREEQPRAAGNPPGQPEPVPEVPERCFWVQVGAFADVANARRARQALDGSGEEAVVLVGPSGLSRVRIGPFEAREPAERARERVLPAWPEAQVVECGG